MDTLFLDVKTLKSPNVLHRGMFGVIEGDAFALRHEGNFKIDQLKHPRF